MWGPHTQLGCSAGLGLELRKFFYHKPSLPAIELSCRPWHIQYSLRIKRRHNLTNLLYGTVTTNWNTCALPTDPQRSVPEISFVASFTNDLKEIWVISKCRLRLVFDARTTPWVRGTCFASKGIPREHREPLPLCRRPNCFHQLMIDDENSAPLVRWCQQWTTLKTFIQLVLKIPRERGEMGSPKIYLGGRTLSIPNQSVSSVSF